eukprot:135343-Chlamydomonas_euryale.AAC.5
MSKSTSDVASLKSDSPSSSMLNSSGAPPACRLADTACDRTMNMLVARRGRENEEGGERE